MKQNLDPTPLQLGAQFIFLYIIKSRHLLLKHITPFNTQSNYQIKQIRYDVENRFYPFS